MVKLVDTPDLGSGAARCEGSSPFTRTIRRLKVIALSLFLYKKIVSLVKSSKMKNSVFWLFSLLLCNMFTSFGQSKEHEQLQKKKFINYYLLNPKISHQDTVYFSIGKRKELLKAGWVVVENKKGFVVQRTIEKDTLIESIVDSAVQVNRTWKIENINVNLSEIGKLNLNPVVFVNSGDKMLNNIAHVKIPVNDVLVLKHFHTKWSAITIPFSIRPAIGGNVRSQVTNEFKIGSAFSLNYDWEFYKNRRLEIKRNTYGLSFGFGFGLGRIVLDNASTSLSLENYDNEEQGLAVFVTPGLGLNIRGFKFLGFFGYDIGLTSNVKDWNYNKRPYLGIGFGFDFWTLKRTSNTIN